MAQFLPPPEHVTGPVPQITASPRHQGAESSREKDAPSPGLHSPQEVIAPLRPFPDPPHPLRRIPLRFPASLFSRPALTAVPPALIIPCALNRDDHRFSRMLRSAPG